METSGATLAEIKEQNLRQIACGYEAGKSRLRELLGINGSLPFRIRQNDPDRFVKYPRFSSPACQIPWAESLITPDGKVTIGCCSSYELGDLRKDSFAAVWNGRRYRKLRKTVNGRKPLPPCQKGSCPFR